MTTAFNPTTAGALADACEADDLAMSPGDWHAGDCISPKIALYVTPAPHDHDDVVYLGRVYADGNGQGRRNLKAIARSRNNLPAIAQQLRSAAEEVERLKKLCGEACTVAEDACKTALGLVDIAAPSLTTFTDLAITDVDDYRERINEIRSTLGGSHGHG